MNLLQIEQSLKNIPDDELTRLVNEPNPRTPAFLVLGEMQRRKDMRLGAGQNAAPQGGTVKDRLSQFLGSGNTQQNPNFIPQNQMVNPISSGDPRAQSGMPGVQSFNDGGGVWNRLAGRSFGPLNPWERQQGESYADWERRQAALRAQAWRGTDPSIGTPTVPGAAGNYTGPADISAGAGALPGSGLDFKSFIPDVPVGPAPTMPERGPPTTFESGKTRFHPSSVMDPYKKIIEGKGTGNQKFDDLMKNYEGVGNANPDFRKMLPGFAKEIQDVYRHIKPVTDKIDKMDPLGPWWRFMTGQEDSSGAGKDRLEVTPRNWMADNPDVPAFAKDGSNWMAKGLGIATRGTDDGTTLNSGNIDDYFSANSEEDMRAMTSAGRRGPTPRNVGGSGSGGGGAGGGAGGPNGLDALMAKYKTDTSGLDKWLGKFGDAQAKMEDMKAQNRNMALIKFGLATAASKSPYFAQALAEGGEAAMNQFLTTRKGENEMEMQFTRLGLSAEQAKIAVQQGDRAAVFGLYGRLTQAKAALGAAKISSAAQMEGLKAYFKAINDPAAMSRYNILARQMLKSKGVSDKDIEANPIGVDKLADDLLKERIASIFKTFSPGDK